MIGAVDTSAGGIWIAYIRKALGASQLVVAAPVTGSLFIISLFSPRDITETVGFPRKWTAGDTAWVLLSEFQIRLQVFAKYCSMDAVSSVLDNRGGNTFGMDLYVAWDASEAVVDVSSAGVVPLRNLPDAIGLVGHRDNATESHLLQGRDPRSIRVLVPDGRGLNQDFHDVTIVDMGDLPESHVSMSELAELIHKWPPAVINHMMWRQRELEQMRKVAKIKFRQKHPMPCAFCGTIIKTDMYRHVARSHLELAQLWRCPVSWCTVWKGTPQDLMDHIQEGHNVPGEIRKVSLEMLFPPWTVTRQLYAGWGFR